MKSTREKILRTLLAFPGSTINDLAEAVGINGISIRHHLTALEAENLVTASEERHGVGRPRLIYTLTDWGIEKFPTSYLRLTQRIMDSLSAKMSPTELKALFEEIGAQIAEPYEIGLEGKSLDARIKLTKTALTNEGFIVEVKNNEDHYILTSLSCPYYRVGLDHPVVCTLDHTLISRLTGSPIEIDACICEGFNHCTFIIPRHQEGKYD
jgi:DeoR family transcriptional regulator, suf operon transcriptional repressor